MEITDEKKANLIENNVNMILKRDKDTEKMYISNKINLIYIAN